MSEASSSIPSFVELYNDRFIDLLDPDNAPHKRNRGLPCAKPKKIEIREDTKNKTVFLTGVQYLENSSHVL